MPPLPLAGLQHVSLCVRDPDASTAFYRDVLGFAEVKRPACLEESFDGSWLWGYGLGIHLIQGDPVPRPAAINPRGDHLSFQSDDLNAVAAALDDLGIPWQKECVVEGGVVVTQIFFKDPDCNMLEVCDCACLPVVPLGRGARRACAWRPSPRPRSAAEGGVPAMSPHGVPTKIADDLAPRASSSSEDERVAVDEFVA